MKWKPLIKKYFEKNIEGTAGDIKLFIINNYISEVKEDVILWIETICSKEPRLKQLWYPLSKHNIDGMAIQKVSTANFKTHLQNMWIKGELGRKETNVGFYKWLYSKQGGKFFSSQP